MIKTKKQFQKPYLEKLKFIDSVKLLLMASSLSNLVIMLLMEFIKLNVNANIIIRNVKRVELRTKVASAALNTKKFKLIY